MGYLTVIRMADSLGMYDGGYGDKLYALLVCTQMVMAGDEWFWLVMAGPWVNCRCKGHNPNPFVHWSLLLPGAREWLGLQ